MKWQSSNKKINQSGIAPIVVLIGMGIAALVTGVIVERTTNLSQSNDTRSHAAGKCDNDTPIGNTACASQNSGWEFVCKYPSKPSSEQWQERKCPSGQTCQGTGCKATPSSGGGSSSGSGNSGGGGTNTCSGSKTQCINGVGVGGGACNGAYPTKRFVCTNPNASDSTSVTASPNTCQMWRSEECPNGCEGGNCLKGSGDLCSGSGRGNCRNGLVCMPMSGGARCAERNCPTDNARQCSGNFVQECQNGSWTNISNCDAGCNGSTNSCNVLACTAGQIRCADNDTALETCNDNRTAWNKRSCPYGCSNNACNGPPSLKKFGELCAGNGQGNCESGLTCSVTCKKSLNTSCFQSSDCVSPYACIPQTGGKYCGTPDAGCEAGDGSAFCSTDQTKLLQCQSYHLVTLNNCANFGCTGGANAHCNAGLCTAGSTQCHPTMANTLQRCNATGSAYGNENCPFGCANGACIQPRLLDQTCTGAGQGNCSTGLICTEFPSGERLCKIPKKTVGQACAQESECENPLVCMSVSGGGKYCQARACYAAGQTRCASANTILETCKSDLSGYQQQSCTCETVGGVAQCKKYQYFTWVEERGRGYCEAHETTDVQILNQNYISEKACKDAHLSRICTAGERSCEGGRPRICNASQTRYDDLPACAAGSICESGNCVYKYFIWGQGGCVERKTQDKSVYDRNFPNIEMCVRNHSADPSSAPTPTPTSEQKKSKESIRTLAKKDIGQACVSSDECKDLMYCANDKCNPFCGETGQKPCNTGCKLAFEMKNGLCQAKNIKVNKSVDAGKKICKSSGFCSEASDCCSGFVCQSSPYGGSSCVALKVQKGGEGQECMSNVCDAGMYCNKDKNICQKKPTLCIPNNSICASEISLQKCSDDGMSWGEEKTCFEGMACSPESGNCMNKNMIKNDHTLGSLCYGEGRGTCDIPYYCMQSSVGKICQKKTTCNIGEISCPSVAELSVCIDGVNEKITECANGRTCDIASKSCAYSGVYSGMDCKNDDDCRLVGSGRKCLMIDAKGGICVNPDAKDSIGSLGQLCLIGKCIDGLSCDNTNHCVSVKSNTLNEQLVNGVFNGVSSITVTTIADLESVIGSQCKDVGSTIFNGKTIYENGESGNCRLICDLDNHVIKDKFNCGIDTTFKWNELRCQEGETGNIIRFESEQNSDIVIEKQCGKTYSGAQSLCRDGKCIDNTIPCIKDGEIIPDTDIIDTYRQCDAATHTWKPFADGKKIIWQDCPTSYREYYLENMSKYQSELLPGSEVTIKCRKSMGDILGFVYPSKSGDNLASPVNLSCGDPSSEIATYSIDGINWISPKDACKQVLTHEFMHGWQVVESGQATSEPFTKVIGCYEVKGKYYFNIEDPVSAYGYTNCAEALAEAAAYYVHSGCWMRDNRKKQYDWFLTSPDSPFVGISFCK